MFIKLLPLSLINFLNSYSFIYIGQHPIIWEELHNSALAIQEAEILIPILKKKKSWELVTKAVLPKLI